MTARGSRDERDEYQSRSHATGSRGSDIAGTCTGIGFIERKKNEHVLDAAIVM